MPAPTPDQLARFPKAASCARCGGRHLPELRCWSGRYARAVSALTIATYGDRCCHCHRPGAGTAEHIRPRSRGGTDELSNLAPAHLRCNQSRGTRPMPGWTDHPTSSRQW